MVAKGLLIRRGRALRRRMTLPEVLLWRELKRRALGHRFRRQHPFESWILDFYCAEARLAVEVDGWGHNMGDQPARDERRDAALAREGIRVLRLEAALVWRDIDGVIRTIEAALS